MFVTVASGGPRSVTRSSSVVNVVLKVIFAIDMEANVVALLENGSAGAHRENLTEYVIQSPSITSVDGNGSSAVIANKNPLHIGPRVPWEDWETEYFIRLVINAAGPYAYRRKRLPFYSTLVAPLAAVGINRNALELRNKWQRLKQYYSDQMAKNRNANKQWTTRKMYYHLLHKVFHGKPVSNDTEYLCQTNLNAPSQNEIPINLTVPGTRFSEIEIE